MYTLCVLTLVFAVCRPDGMLGMATHRILHKVEPGKLKMELTDKKGTNTGEISFILQASGGRFAQSSGSGTGTGSGMGTGTGTTSQHGTGHGTGSGMGAGAAALAAGTLVLSIVFFAMLQHISAITYGAYILMSLQELALAVALALAQAVRRQRTCHTSLQLPLVHALVPLVPLVLVCPQA